MNYKEIINQLEILGITKDEFGGYDDVDDSIKGIGTQKLVENYSGEGDGHTTRVVRHFVDHDVYIQLTGWYSSYDGTDWRDYSEVKPKEKTITIYEEVR